MPKIAFPTFSYEISLWEKGVSLIAGIDEVGRGAFAGPVVSAAVILPPDFPQNLGIHDSKLLSAQKRQSLVAVIKEKAISYSITEVCVLCINEMGIGKATQKCFFSTLSSLPTKPLHILSDAFYISGIKKTKQTPIIKGDQKSLSIASASILAKVYRDSLMTELAKTYPPYGFEKNAGYGTLSHRVAIKQFGLSDVHRSSFSLTKYT